MEQAKLPSAFKAVYMRCVKHNCLIKVCEWERGIVCQSRLWLFCFSVVLHAFWHLTASSCKDAILSLCFHELYIFGLSENLHLSNCGLVFVTSK